MERCLWCWCYFAKAFARNRSSSNSNSVSSLGKGWNCEDQPAISHWEKYTISQVIQRKFFRWCLEAPNRAIGINNWHLATFTARGLWGVVAAALLVAFQATLDVGPLLEAPAHTCHFMSAVCSKPRWKESQVQPLSFMDASTKCMKTQQLTFRITSFCLWLFQFVDPQISRHCGSSSQIGPKHGWNIMNSKNISLSFYFL